MNLNIENYPEITFFETVPRRGRLNPDSITFQFKKIYNGQTFYNQCEFSKTFIKTMQEEAQKELDNFYIKSIETFEKEKAKTQSAISRHGLNSKQRFWAMESEETGIMLWDEDPKKTKFLKIDK